MIELVVIVGITYILVLDLYLFMYCTSSNKTETTTTLSLTQCKLATRGKTSNISYLPMATFFDVKENTIFHQTMTTDLILIVVNEIYSTTLFSMFSLLLFLFPPDVLCWLFFIDFFFNLRHIWKRLRNMKSVNFSECFYIFKEKKNERR